MPAACPDRELLSAWYEGRLSVAEADTWSPHVKSCTRCLQVLEQWKGSGVAGAIASDDPPRVLGEYVLLDLIGAGGMGRVYKARHQRMDRIVALKVISPDLVQGEEAVRRFEREVRAAARLLHPNVVAAFDASRCGDTHFLVMEYVAGQDLATMLRKRERFEVQEAVRLVLQAAQALAYAHDHGIVHRDIKPANLIVDAHGTLKVLDLGLARLDRESQIDELTHSGQMMGTVDYMAPEQAMDPQSADVRSDIYSLGCTLYRLVSGKVLLPSAAGKLVAHRETPIPDLATSSGNVSPALNAVFQRMVAKRPEQRFQTMKEVIAALTAAVGSSTEATLLTEPLPEVSQVASPPSTNPWPRFLAVGGLAVVAVVAMLYWSGLLGSRGSPSPVVPAIPPPAEMLFATRVAADGQALDAGTSFPVDTRQIYAVFRSDAPPPGLKINAEQPQPERYYCYVKVKEYASVSSIGWRWYHEGKVVNEYETPTRPGSEVWLQAFNGDRPDQPLFGDKFPPGKYTVVILLGGNPSFTNEFTITVGDR